MSKLVVPALVVMLASTACGYETRDHSVVAVLSGVVTHGAAAPLTGASIHMEVTDTAGGPWYIRDRLGVTDSAGELVRVIGLFLTPEFVGRVRVTVEPPESVSLPDSTFNVGHLRFRIGTPDTLSFALAYP